MSVLIRVGIRKAILRAGRWLCADLGLERRLNESTSDWIKEAGGPRLDDKDPEKTVAEEMARRVQGRVLLHCKPKGNASSSYFLEQRQLELNFDAFIPVTAKPPKPPRKRMRKKKR